MSATRRPKRSSAAPCLEQPILAVSGSGLREEHGNEHTPPRAADSCTSPTTSEVALVSDAANKRQRVESDMSDSSLPAMTGHAVHVQDSPDAGMIAPKIAR